MQQVAIQKKEMEHNEKTEQKQNDFKPKFYRFERAANGKKLMCIRGRSRGEKREIKLTLEQIIEEFEKA